MRKMLINRIEMLLKAGCDWKQHEEVIKEDEYFSVDVFRYIKDLQEG